MELTMKQISNIIYEANREWDMNPMTKYFADVLAKAIINCEEKQIKNNIRKPKRKGEY